MLATCLEVPKPWIQFHQAFGKHKLSTRISLELNLTTKEFLRESLALMQAMGYPTIPFTRAISPTQCANWGNIWVLLEFPDERPTLVIEQFNQLMVYSEHARGKTIENILVAVL